MYVKSVWKKKLSAHRNLAVYHHRHRCRHLFNAYLLFDVHHHHQYHNCFMCWMPLAIIFSNRKQFMCSNTQWFHSDHCSTFCIYTWALFSFFFCCLLFAILLTRQNRQTIDEYDATATRHRIYCEYIFFFCFRRDAFLIFFFFFVFPSSHSHLLGQQKQPATARETN